MTTEGLSKQGVDHFHDVLAGYVERGYLPGLVALVSRGDDVHVDAIGTTAFDRAEPMRRDTIFRIASMTKPVTAAAALSLIADGSFGLADAVDTYLPELADRRVLRAIDGPLDDTVPAQRSPTVRELLDFRMGFGAILAPPLSYPIQRAWRERALGGDAPPQPATVPATDEWLRRFAELPFMHQPGESWSYHTGSDVLGVLITRLTGRSLGDCLRERVLSPLGMDDTAFSVPADKQGRLPTSYHADFETGELSVLDRPDDSQWASPPAFESGGGGLVSTADDYLAFTRTLVTGGAPVLSPEDTLALTTNQLTPDQQAVTVPFTGGAGGWGFGVAALPDRYGWNGGLGTNWWTARASGLIAILLTQRTAFPPSDPLHLDFWAAAQACAA